MFQVWWVIQIRLYFKFTSEFNSEKILKIGYPLAKLDKVLTCSVYVLLAYVH